MEQRPKKGFRYWFVNVFWYHYGKISLLVLFLVGSAVFLTVDALRKEKYDLNVALIVDRAVARDDTAALGELFASAAGDVDGNGQAKVNIVTVNLASEENVEAVQYRIMLDLSQPEYTVFLMSGYESSVYAAQEDTFQPLADYGFQGAEEDGMRLFVGNKAILRDLGITDCYVCLSDWTVDGRGSEEMTAAAVRAISALVDSPDVPGEEN